MELRNLFETLDIAPTVLYHQSPRANRDSILDKGLLRSRSETAEIGMSYGEEGAGGIFLSNTIDHSHPLVDVWEVHVQGLNLERDETTDHEHLGEQWWVCWESDIGPERLNLLSDRIITEAPIADFHHVGNFEKSHGFRHPQDRKLLTNPKALTKMKSQWKYPSETFFNIILLNVPMASDSRYRMTETGIVDIDYLETNLKPEVFQQVEGVLDMNKANVIYTNNSGTDRAPMTAWIMAHRLGHALQATNRFRKSNHSAAHYFQDASNEFERTMSDVMRQHYGIVSKNKLIPLGVNGPVVGFMREVCKTRTAREKTLTRPYEVVYESLAQYMFSGKVSFNPPPKSFKYGPSTYNFRGDHIEHENATEQLEYLGETMTDLFEVCLQYCEGKIFVM